VDFECEEIKRVIIETEDQSEKKRIDEKEEITKKKNE
jgi:hypothetical protein